MLLRLHQLNAGNLWCIDISFDSIVQFVNRDTNNKEAFLQLCDLEHGRLYSECFSGDLVCCCEELKIEVCKRPMRRYLRENDTGVGKRDALESVQESSVLCDDVVRKLSDVLSRLDSLPEHLLQRSIVNDNFSMGLMQDINESLDQQIRLIDAAKTTGPFYDCVQRIKPGIPNVDNITEGYLSHIRTANKLFLQSTTVIAVTGEESAGAVASINGIIGHHCLSEDSNLAYPLRVVVDRNAIKPRLVLPRKLKRLINELYDCLYQSVDFMKRNDILLGTDHLLLSEKEKKILKDIENAVGTEPTIQPPQLFLSSADIEGARAIQDCLEKINNILRLVCTLKEIRNFAASGLRRCDPTFCTGTQIEEVINVLPTVYTRCVFIEPLPYVGQLNFIYTPSISEARPNGLHTQGLKEMLDQIWKESNHTLVFTTAETRTSSAARDLIVRVKSAAGTKMKLVVDMSDGSVIRTQGGNLMDVLQRIRYEHLSLDDISPSNVHWFHPVYFKVAELGRSSVIKSKGETDSLTVDDIVSSCSHGKKLVEFIFGDQWGHIIESQGAAFTVAGFCQEIQALAMKSNFGNILGMCVLPSFVGPPN